LDDFGSMLLLCLVVETLVGGELDTRSLDIVNEVVSVLFPNGRFNRTNVGGCEDFFNRILSTLHALDYAGAAFFKIIEEQFDFFLD